jgi:hypothetical protein
MTQTHPNETGFGVSPRCPSRGYVSEAAVLGRVGKRPGDAILEIDVAHSGVFRSRRSICPNLRHLPVRQLICASVAPAPILGLPMLLTQPPERLRCDQGSVCIDADADEHSLHPWNAPLLKRRVGRLIRTVQDALRHV